MKEEVPVKKRGSRTWQKQQKIRQSNSASQPCAPCSRPGLAASPLRARALPPARCPVVCELFLFPLPSFPLPPSLCFISSVFFVTQSTTATACSGKLAPLQDAALRRATQACSVRGSRQGPRRTTREAVRLQSPACARKWAAAELLPECVVSQLCSTACNISQPCCAYLLGQQQLFQSRPRRETSGAGSPKASSQQPQRQKLTGVTLQRHRCVLCVYYYSVCVGCLFVPPKFSDTVRV